MTDLFQSPADLSEYLFRIVDNNGATLDQITVIFSDGDYLGLSITGAGFSQWGDGIDPADIADRVEEGFETDLTWSKLDPALQRHILYRLNEAWRDFVEAEKAAPCRDKATPNDGTYDSAGKGIYRHEGAFWMAHDNGPEDDAGPFSTYREAVLRTLPDAYSLSGPEYHPPVNVLE
ncbi:hypothetical protein [Sphingobium sp. MK2]|uniref:hypothetical protein n=1 Tax=Sphingobium sp. MK2 TaxID=3116540 RepID=UPI0032E35986